MFLLTLLLLFIFAVSFKWTRHKQNILKYVRHLPSFKEIPLLGSAHIFIGKNTKEIMQIIVDVTTSTETPSRFWLGPQLIVIIGKAEDMQTILNSPNCLQKTYVYKFFEENVGLFTAPAHVWKPLRKLLNPTFNHKILTSFVPIFNQKVEVLAKNLDATVNISEPFDISPYLYACTLDMVCATTLGIDLEHQANKNKELLECIEKMSALVANRMAKVWLHPEWIYKLTSDYRKYAEMFNIVTDYTTKVRKAKQLEFQESKIISKDSRSDDDFFTTPQIFVNELLKIHEMGTINDHELDDHVMTMLVGGNETTGLTISNVILMLAIHQDMQEKVFQEVKAAHHSQTSHTDYATMSKLVYLEMFIKETMRHLPIAPFLARDALADTPIRKCVIPKGTMIFLSFHNLHTDKDVWGTESHKFNPEHFLPEKNAARHPYAYLPFSAGPRNCIGIKYGWMSMKTMVSMLVRRYKFTTDFKFEDLAVKWDITLKLVNKHLVRMERRSY